MPNDVIELPGTAYRPEMSYETKDGRLVPEQNEIAMNYLRGLLKQINTSRNSELVDTIGKEMFAFVRTLPEEDKIPAIDAIVAGYHFTENIGF